ncbi:expressed protein, partial [Phakopsora pachyrhizi]
MFKRNKTSLKREYAVHCTAQQQFQQWSILLPLLLFPPTTSSFLFTSSAIPGAPWSTNLPSTLDPTQPIPLTKGLPRL